MLALNENYWSQRYEQKSTGWDVGRITTPLKEYFDQLENRALSILIPGAGNAYEAEYLHSLGFSKVDVLDFSALPLQSFKQRNPDWPVERLIQSDFFAWQGQYDLIVEQTFFCALDPSLRARYAKHMKQLLKPGGKLVGVLFDAPMNSDQPPFGGKQEEYKALFSPYFQFKHWSACYNSIPPRAGKEWFMVLQA
ncbi:methyltransferase domain-containing protein [Cytophagales bacterium LB-30]|uniref:Methyltransferase domain-containing protein n=1 Tax=Shiella aurantiaca TaxID=3058365 RepID=A0ABT8F4U7_9BACT|nr:methyltransferase domain-containing protein [Shiella aurantiaca]MDN4165251.1 methyltransferase domain-containing protein [Shiella aurantiaca]